MCLTKSEEPQSEATKSKSNTQPLETGKMEHFVWDDLTWKLILKGDPAIENGEFTVIRTLCVQWTPVSTTKSIFLSRF